MLLLWIKKRSELQKYCKLSLKYIRGSGFSPRGWIRWWAETRTFSHPREWERCTVQRKSFMRLWLQVGGTSNHWENSNTSNTKTHSVPHRWPTWQSHAWSCRCASWRWGWPGLWLAPPGVCRRETWWVFLHWLKLLSPFQLLLPRGPTLWRPPWWLCKPPPLRCPSETCPGKAGNAPGEYRHHVEPTTWCIWKVFKLYLPLRRGWRSCGSRWGSSWSLTAAATPTRCWF